MTARLHGRAARFLSTLPARGATHRPSAAYLGVTISIHAPREGSDLDGRCRPVGLLISIHAPREGSDGINVDADVVVVVISIHAPREGSDRVLWRSHQRYKNFYPRSPRGERRWATSWPACWDAFLSTLPARGATMGNPSRIFFLQKFLSTLPARGATQRV